MAAPSSVVLLFGLAAVYRQLRIPAGGNMTDALLHGRTALVTGGANGIGRAVAQRLARAGAAVTVVDRDELAVKEVATAIGGRAVVANLLDTDALESLDLASDILVNNAGFQHVAPVDEFPPQTFEDIITLMLVVP